MNYGTIPADTLAELLLYINEHESFDSLKNLGTVSREAFGSALKSLVKQIKADSVEKVELPNFRDWKELAKPFREILDKLSPREAKLLLKGFGA